jgi:hypothetical protein
MKTHLKNELHYVYIARADEEGQNGDRLVAGVVAAGRGCRTPLQAAARTGKKPVCFSRFVLK